MSPRWATALVLIAVGGCERPLGPVAEDAVGDLGPMHFERVDDDCRPQRTIGETGALFVGRQASGRLVVTTSLESFWGPARDDAGSLIAGSRTDFVTGDDLELVLGGEPTQRCARLRYRWTDLGVDGGVRHLGLTQHWVAVDPGCPERYAHLPERDCTSVRRVTFTPRAPCRLQCLSPTAADFTCGC